MEPSKRRMKTMATQALHLTPIMIHFPPPCCVSSGGPAFLLSLCAPTLSPEHLYTTVPSTFLLLHSVFVKFLIGFRSSLDHKLASESLPSCVHTTVQTQFVTSCFVLLCSFCILRLVRWSTLC